MEENRDDNELSLLKRKLYSLSSSVDFHFQFITAFEKMASSGSDSDDETDEENNNQIGGENNELINNPIMDGENERENHANDAKRIVYRQRMHRGNYDTLCLIRRSRFSSAKKLSKLILHYAPTNFNALWNKAKLLIEEKVSSESVEVGLLLDQLGEVVTTDANEMLIAKAEIASMHLDYDIAEDSIVCSIRLLEEVLLSLESLSNASARESIPDYLIDFWKLRLVKSFIQLFSEDHDFLTKHGYTEESILTKIRDSVWQVMESKHLGANLKSSIWRNFGSLLEKYVTTTLGGNLETEMFEGLSPKRCFEEAFELNQNNYRLLLNSVRFKSMNNSVTDDELKRYIELMKLCTKCEAQQHRALFYMGLNFRLLWLRNDRIDFVLASEPFEEAEHCENGPPKGCLVIKAPNCIAWNIPRPYKYVPEKVLKQVINPLAPDLTNLYLQNARRCFKEANDIKPSMSHALHLARILISIGEIDKAKECLTEADKLPFGIVRTALYETMGVLVHREIITNYYKDVEEIEKAKQYYREAIRHGILYIKRLYVSVHYLLQLLHHQLQGRHAQNETDELMIQNEYFLIYMTIQQTDSHFFVLDVLVNDCTKRRLMWKLIRQFYLRNRSYDGAAAFAYLTVFVITQKFELDTDLDLTMDMKLKMLLQSGIEAALSKPVQSLYLPQTYQWLCDFQDSDLVPRPRFDYHFGILTERKTSEVDVLKSIIRKQFQRSFHVIELARSNLTTPSCSVDSLINNKLKKMQSILVLTTKLTTDAGQQTIQQVLEHQTNSKRRRLCQVVLGVKQETVIYENISSCYLESCSTPASENTAQHDRCQVQDACTLLRVLFSDIQSS